MVTIVVPNHNEPMIDQTLAGLRTLGCPIVVSSVPGGIGKALREGLKDVETEWVLFAMADGSEGLHSLREMLKYCGDPYDAVWGDRWEHPNFVAGYPRWKHVLNRLGNHLIAWCSIRPRYRDWTDLAKAYRTDKLRRIRWSDDFRCAVEIPLRYNPRCLAVLPRYWTERTAGRSTYRLSHALGCLFALGKVILRG
jgi:dolichol-phosphate mannosyltransferase